MTTTEIKRRVTDVPWLTEPELADMFGQSALGRLSDAEIRRLWNEVFSEADYGDWLDRYVARLESVERLDGIARLEGVVPVDDEDDGATEVDAFRDLWGSKAARDLGELVGSEAAVKLDIRELLADEREAVRNFLAIRNETWPRDAEQRAQALQERFDHDLEWLTAFSDRAPRYKLARVFAQLLPHDAVASFSAGARVSISRLLLGPERRQIMEVQVLARARLRAVLGPEDDLEDHARRSIFCVWLAEQAEQHVVRRTARARGARRPLEDARALLPPFVDLHERVQAHAAAGTLVFSERQVIDVDAAWRSQPKKHFVVLQGLSGTGKTRLVQTYAQAVCDLLDLNSEDHVVVAAVSPDWTDPTGLLGYADVLNDRFRKSPVMDLVLRAVDRPNEPFFLVLDEMNLARVEKYFAPFLSAMESGEPLQLHGEVGEVAGVPGRIPWPTNLFVAGTVNLDETTHSLSDKVVDRAFTFEYWDADLPSYFDRLPEGDRAKDVETLLVGLYEVLRPARRHFGYRTAREVLAFVGCGPEYEGAAGGRTELIDQAVFSKILPRLRGEDTPSLQKALQGALKLCRKGRLATCADKLDELLESLSSFGVMRF